MERVTRLHWSVPTCRQPFLTDGEVHCWAMWLDIPPALIEKHSLLLSRDEQERATRFRVEKARRGFVVARSFLRQLLGKYLDLPPEEILFFYGANGKPFVAPWMSQGLQFNLSHSDKVALIAITANHEVGIDVERITSVPEADEIAKLFFPHEAAGRAKSEAQISQEFFFRSWTRSEAVLKCSGDGICDDAKTALHLSKALVCELNPAAGYVGAVAVNSFTPMQVKAWQWQENAPPKTEMQKHDVA